METLRKLWRKKVLIIFLTASLILLPAASVKPAQMLSKTLLVSIGISKTDGDEYEVSGAMVVNKFSDTAESSTKVISEAGNTPTQALNKLSANQGSSVSLAHCNLVILGNKLEKENIAADISTFLRKYEMSNTALLIWTNGDPKKLQEISVKNETSAGAGLAETVAAYNQEKILGKQTTIETFFKDYLRPSSTSLMGVVELQGDAIVNKIDIAVFKNGKYAQTLTADETLAISLLQGQEYNRSIVINKVQGDTLSEADVELRLLEKHSCIKTEFKNGKPHVTVTLTPKLNITDITEREALERYLSIEEDSPIDDIKTAFNSLIALNMEKAVIGTQKTGSDLLQIYDMFYRAHNAETKQFLQTKSIDDLLNETSYKIEVDSQIAV